MFHVSIIEKEISRVKALERYERALTLLNSRFGHISYQRCSSETTDFLAKYINHDCEFIDYAEGEDWKLASVIYVENPEIRPRQKLLFWLPEDVCEVELKLLISE